MTFPPNLDDLWIEHLALFLAADGKAAARDASSPAGHRSRPRPVRGQRARLRG